MEDKQLALLPLSKETLERTPPEVFKLLLRLVSRVEELERRLNKHSGNSDKPLSSDSLYLLLRKQPWQRAARAAFCHFSAVALGDNFVRRRECDAL